MWATLAFSAALGLTPAQKDTLELKNARVTYSVLGAERKDSKLYPGDIYVLTFDIVGLSVGKDGRVQYSMGMELTRKVGGGKPPALEFRQRPRPYEAVNTLGGSRLPSYALSAIGTDAKEGEYTLKVTVTDRGTKPNVTKTLERTFQVVRPKLGFVRVGLSYNESLPAPAVAVPGQTLFLNFHLVGFTLDKKKRPDLVIEMRVLDAENKPTVDKPYRGEIKKLVDNRFEQLLPFEPIALQMNRAGKYTVVLTATDNLARMKTEHRIALTVVDNK